MYYLANKGINCYPLSGNPLKFCCCECSKLISKCDHLVFTEKIGVDEEIVDE